MDINTLVGSGGGVAGGLMAGILFAKKFLNGKKVCPAQTTLDEMHNACVLLRESVERNTRASDRAADALLTVVKALTTMRSE